MEISTGVGGGGGNEKQQGYAKEEKGFVVRNYCIKKSPGVSERQRCEQKYSSGREETDMRGQ